MSLPSPTLPAKKLAAIYHKACAARFCYDRLSIDLPHLSIAIVAVENAELRTEIVGEVEDAILTAGFEIPPCPAEFKIAAEVLDGTAPLQKIPLEDHFSDCRKADVALARALRSVPEWQHYLPKLHLLFDELKAQCTVKFEATAPTRPIRKKAVS